MYQYEEVFSKTVEYFNGNELSAKVWIDKYALRDNDNNLLELTPDDMHRRLAKEFARIEKKKFKHPLSEEEIYLKFKNFRKFIPQGSPMMGIGNPYQICSLSNCFVLESPYDSYAGILYADQQLVQIAKRRGGNGIDLDNLRPTGFATHNASRTSSGIATWMTRYSNSTREVGQKGRRGALMETISVHHPDVIIFATIKNDDKAVTGSNISIKLTDEFLSAVEHDTEYEQRWPVNSETPKFSRMVKARDVWQTIIHSAWLRAEPGLLFWDNIIRNSIADCYADQGYRTVSTNPCGEIPLSELDSCRLFAINLCGYVQNPYTESGYFDYKTFYNDVIIAQRLMDDLVDLEIEAIDKILHKIKNDSEPHYIKTPEIDLWSKIKQACINGRRTGLGITGLGDCLASINIKYATKKSIETVSLIYKTLKLASYYSSMQMAKELKPFPIWNVDKECDHIFLTSFRDDIIELNDDHIVYGDSIYKDILRYGRRNIANLTTAPTGTLSIMAGMEVNGKMYYNLSSGIEPVIMAEYQRKKKGNPGDKHFRSDEVDKLGDHWMKFNVYHSGIQAWLDVNQNKTFEDSPYFNCTSADINWVNRVKLQAAAQRHVDHSISSTINLPKDVSEEEVAKIYETAWKAGCKGITVYRDGCRSGVLVKTETGIPKHNAPTRPKELPCDVYHVSIKGKEYFVLVGKLDNDPYEVFAGRNGIIDAKVKNGKIIRLRKNFYKAILDDGTELSPITLGCDEHEETITRLVSISLRHGTSIEFIVEQLSKIQGDMNSYAKSIARSLKKYISDGTDSGEDCSECGNKLIYSEGCQKCMSCGYSKCS